METKRNYGIDLLRIISMFMVIGLHIYGKGGALTVGHPFSWYTYIMLWCAVDCYALITGFVSYSESPKEYKYARYVELWFQVVFYGILVVAIMNVPYVSGRFGDTITVKDFVKAILPVTFRQYWYFGAYTGIILVKPWLDSLVRSMSRKNALYFMLMLLFILMLHMSLGNLGFSIFEFAGGYSFIWLAVLYLLGACIRKFELNNIFSKFKLLILYFVLVSLTWISRPVIEMSIESVFGLRGWENTFVQYVSPTILGCAFCLLSFFSQLQLHTKTKKLIAFAAPASFGVYLLHVQPLVFEQIIDSNFLWIVERIDVFIRTVIASVINHVDKIISD